MRRLSSILAPATLLIGVVYLGQGIFFRGRVLSGPDLVNYFIPTTHFARPWLREGILPLWNPMTFCGWPLVADPQLRWMYPPNGLLLVLDPAFAFSILVLAHMAFGALGMWVYLRQVLRTGSWAAACGAASFGLGGFFANHLMSGIVVFPATAAWVPWILLLGWRLGAPGASVRTVALFAGALGLQVLAGAPQIVFYTCLVVFYQGLWRAAGAAVHVRRNSSSPVPAVRAAIRILAFYAIGAAIALSVGAAGILPAAEFGALSFQRGQKASWEEVVNCSIAPRYLWLTVAPRFFDNPHAEGTYWAGRGAQQEGYWDISGYAGIGPIAALLVLLFSGSGFFRGRSRTPSDEEQPRPRAGGGVAFHLTLAGLALFLALGRHNLLFRWLYDWVPGFDRFRVPGRWLLFWEFGLAAVFAWVVERLAAPASDGAAIPRRALIGPLALAGGLALCAAASPAVMAAAKIRDTVPTFVPHRRHPLYGQMIATTTGSLQRGGLFALGWLVLFAAGAGRNAPWRRAVPPIAALLVLVDVVGYGTFTATTRTRRSQIDEFYPRSPLIEHLASSARGRRILALDDVHDWQVDQNQPELWANRAVLHDLHDARGYYPLCLCWFGRFANALNDRYATHPLGGLLQPVGPSPQMFTSVNPGLLAMLDVKCLLSYRDLPIEGLRLVQRTSFGLAIYEAADRRGPAWLARSRPTGGLTDEQEVALLRSPDFDRAHEALASSPPPRDWPTPGGDPAGTASLQRASPNRIVVEVERKAADLLVVSEAYHPGWRAVIDQRPAPVVRANHALIGVYVPPGAPAVRRVELTFQPTSFRVGLYMTCVAWLILAAALAATVKRRPERNENGSECGL